MESLEGPLARLLVRRRFDGQRFLLLLHGLEGAGARDLACLEEVDAVGVDEALALALDLEVVSDHLDG